MAAEDDGARTVAGAIGDEPEHGSMRRAIGQIPIEQVDESPRDAGFAPGASCRTHLGDRPCESDPDHPIESRANALRGPGQS